MVVKGIQIIIRSTDRPNYNVHNFDVIVKSQSSAYSGVRPDIMLIDLLMVDSPYPLEPQTKNMI